MSRVTAFETPGIEVRSPKPLAALVVLTGEHDLYSAGEVQQAIDEALAVCIHLIIDLSAVAFIDSSIVALLVQTKKSATALGRRFDVVLGTAPVVERILEITGVRPLLNIVPTVEQALAA